MAFEEGQGRGGRIGPVVGKFGRLCGSRPRLQALGGLRYYLSTSSKYATARGSLDCPSQNMASLRTMGLVFWRAMLINIGTLSSLGSWLSAKTAFFFT